MHKLTLQLKGWQNLGAECKSAPWSYLAQSCY